MEKAEETSLKVLGHLRIQGVDQRRLVGEVVIERADADPRGPADVLEADHRHGHLRELEACDVGLRLVVGTPA